ILMRGDGEHADLLNSLSAFLRMSINRNNEYITLLEELDTVKHYMRLVNFINKEHINLSCIAPPEYLEHKVPRFILQPLVENAIFHGLQQQKGEISVRVMQNHDDAIIITVEDNGIGMSLERLQSIRKWVTSDNGQDENN